MIRRGPSPRLALRGDRPWAPCGPAWRGAPVLTPGAFTGGRSEAVRAYLAYLCSLRTQRARKGMERS